MWPCDKRAVFVQFHAHAQLLGRNRDTTIHTLTNLIGLVSKIFDATKRHVIDTIWKRCLLISLPERRKRSQYDRAMIAVPRDIEKSSAA